MLSGARSSSCCRARLGAGSEDPGGSDGSDRRSDGPDGPDSRDKTSASSIHVVPAECCIRIRVPTRVSTVPDVGTPLSRKWIMRLAGSQTTLTPRKWPGISRSLHAPQLICGGFLPAFQRCVSDAPAPAPAPASINSSETDARLARPPSTRAAAGSVCLAYSPSRHATVLGAARYSRATRW